MTTRKGDQFAGLTVALVTPFTDGNVDETALRALVDFHAESGTDCVSPVGTTGESPTLSHDEHEQIIRVVCEQAAGRVRVRGGADAENDGSRRAARRRARFHDHAAALPRGLAPVSSSESADSSPWTPSRPAASRGSAATPSSPPSSRTVAPASPSP